MTGFTVVGFWDSAGKRHVIGVIEGEHNVTGGFDVTDGGLFAVYLEAEDSEDAEAEVHGTTEEDTKDRFE
jgi:hypothetical protein